MGVGSSVGVGIDHLLDTVGKAGMHRACHLEHARDLRRRTLECYPGATKRSPPGAGL